MYKGVVSTYLLYQILIKMRAKRLFFYERIATKVINSNYKQILCSVIKMNNSVWTNDVQMPTFGKLEQDLKTDVLVVGGGLAGILCAHGLAREGVDYALIEADRICVGVSRNTTAKITSQHGFIYAKILRMFGPEKAQKYYEANEKAIQAYYQLSQSIPCDFEWKDNFIYSKESNHDLNAEIDALSHLGIPVELSKNIQFPFSVEGAIRFRKQAQFNPLKFVAGLTKDLRIYEHTTAREFSEHTVITDHCKITASKIIIATHFPILNKHGSYFLKMYQQRSYVLALENAAQVDGMFLDAAENGLSFRNYGDLLLLGGGGHRTGKKGGGWAELERFARIHYPGAREVCRWATQDCMTLDGIPYIGQYSKRTPDLYVATGFNKWGMTSAMVSAMILGDLVQGKENPWTQVFSPSRSILRGQLLNNAFEATVNLLTPTKPRCPHMGCALKWNPLEHSWDCPCHGSRFTNDGRLLDNPATDDLKK